MPALGPSRIACRRVGAGKPVLLLHGFGADRRLMEGCMEGAFALRPGHERIYVDLPGMGESPALEGVPTADRMLDALEAFVDEQLAGKDFLLAGQSYGAYLARGLVKRRAASVRGVAMVCPVIVAPRHLRKKAAQFVVRDEDACCEGARAAEAEGFNSMAVVRSRAIFGRYLAEIAAGLAAADKDFVRRLAQGAYAFSFDPDDLAEPFAKPSLIAAGRQDGIVGWEDALKILPAYPRATFAVLDEAGHHAHLEKEKLLEALLVDWLDRLEP